MLSLPITADLIGPGSPGGIYNYGLGNQLFQIAAILSLAKDNSGPIIFPDLIDKQFGGYESAFAAWHTFIYQDLYPDKSFVKSYYHEPHYHYAPIPYQPGLCIKGYFQSEKYFKHNREYILNFFQPTYKAFSYIKNKYSNKIKNRDILALFPVLGFESKTVSIHIRRGDYINLQDHHPILPISYYEEALNFLIYNFKVIDKILVFSDDIEWCKQNLSFPNMQFIEGNPDYIDLFLMGMSHYNIIANSTFSWWGAWLNSRPDKIVIAPKQWFGPAKSHYDTKDLIPEEWVTL